MANRRFLSAAMTFLGNLLGGGKSAKRAVTQLRGTVGEAAAARIVKEMTGKKPRQEAEEVRSKPREEKKPPKGPGEDGDVIIVSGSSNVHSFSYTEGERSLYVRFLGGSGENRAGPGALYRYSGVPRAVFERMKAANSKGSFVWDELRIRGQIDGHQYDYALVGAAEMGYVPRKATGQGYNPREIQQGGKTYKSNKPGTGRFSGK